MLSMDLYSYVKSALHMELSTDSNPYIKSILHTDFYPYVIFVDNLTFFCNDISGKFI